RHLQAFERLLASEVVSDLAVERQDNKREPKLRVGKHPNRMRQAAQDYFEWNGHLLLNLLRRAAGIKRDHLHLNVRDIRKGFNRQRSKRHDPSGHKKQEDQHYEQRLVERERDDASNHTRSNAAWNYSFEQASRP